MSVKANTIIMPKASVYTDLFEDSWQEISDKWDASYPRYVIKIPPSTDSDWRILLGNGSVPNGVAQRTYGTGAFQAAYIPATVKVGDTIKVSANWSTADPQQGNKMQVILTPSIYDSSTSQYLLSIDKNASASTTIKATVNGALGVWVPVRYDSGYHSWFSISVEVTR